MKKILTLFTFFMSLSILSNAQNILNMELLSNVNYDENCNDIWGYVAPDGSEYAILGTTQATAIHDLSDPANPIEVAYIPGANSTWRDMKHWGEFVYVTADVGQDGLLVIDMSGAPDTISWEYWKPDFEIDGNTNTLRTCHNIYIDENGFIYLSGCNMNGGGNLILDAKTDDGIPVFVGATEPRYSHDAYVRGDTLWSSDINDGFFSVIDVSDKTNPVTMATQTTTMNFTHNAWLSTDGKYLFTTDERGNSYVDAYDITDLEDIKLLDSYQPADTRDMGVVPHNAHYLEGGYLVVSWYTDGVKVIDVNRPDNMVEVGSYDTYDGPSGGTIGCWGVTPFLPSGLVLASDMLTGLYVFSPTYVRACYLEGTVRSASTGAMLNDVEVIIESSAINDTATDAMGQFKAGQVEPGTFDVTFNKAGYISQTVSAALVNGEVTMLEIELEPLPTAMVTGTALRDADNNPIAGASILFVSETFQFETTTDADGIFTIAGVFFDDYTIYAGAWGYKNILFSEDVAINADGTYTILLEEAYQDDFIVDLGWTVSGDAERGIWERGEPIGTDFQGTMSNPEMDLGSDIGDQCYVTGNGGGGAGTDDIDGGNTVLTSPIMDLTAYNSPIISYNLWFFNAGGSGTPNDILEVRLSNGIDEVVLETLDYLTPAGQWLERSEFIVLDYIDLTDNMTLIVESGDEAPGHLVEAAIDAFLVLDGMPNATDFVVNPAFEVAAFPNPFNTSLTIEYTLENGFEQARMNIYNVLGQVVETNNLEESAASIQIGQQLPKGVYFVEIQVGKELSETIKIVKE